MRILPLIVVTATLALAGCSKDRTSSAAPGQPTGALPARKYTFAVIPKMLNNPVFQLARKGADAQAARIGADLVEVKFDSSEKGDPTEQAEKIRNLARVSDGLAISVVDENIAREAIDEAVSRGKMVICFDSGAASSKAITLYSVDDRAVGRELAAQLVAACGGPSQMSGKVAILSGQESAPNLRGRIEGAMEILKAHSNLTILPVLYCNDSATTAIDQIRVTMQANPDLRGWVMVGGWPLFQTDALVSIKDPNRTKVVCMDALPQQWEYLENGQVACLVAQKCFGWGEQSIQILYNLCTGAKKPSDYPKLLDSGYDLVYKSATAEQAKAKSERVGVYSLADYKSQYDAWEKGGQSR